MVLLSKHGRRTRFHERRVAFQPRSGAMPQGRRRVDFGAAGLRSDALPTAASIGVGCDGRLSARCADRVARAFASCAQAVPSLEWSGSCPPWASPELFALALMPLHGLCQRGQIAAETRVIRAAFCRGQQGWRRALPTNGRKLTSRAAKTTLLQNGAPCANRLARPVAAHVGHGSDTPARIATTVALPDSAARRRAAGQGARVTRSARTPAWSSYRQSRSCWTSPC